MKDRYRNFIQDQQDPYEDDRPDDEDDEEGYEDEYDEEDEDEASEDDETEEEDDEDSDGEDEIAEDADEEAEDEEEESDDEETVDRFEEMKKKKRDAFQEKSSPKFEMKRPSSDGAYSFANGPKPFQKATPVSPAPPATQSVGMKPSAPVNLTEAGKNAETGSIPIPTTSATPVQTAPTASGLPLSAVSAKPTVHSVEDEKIDFAPMEEIDGDEEEWKKPSLMTRLAGLIPIPAFMKRRRFDEDWDDGNSDEEESNPSKIEKEKSTVPAKRAVFQKKKEEAENENESEEMENGEKSRLRLLRPLTSLMTRIRSRLTKKETLEEFKQEIDEAIETDDESANREKRDWVGIVKKTGIITVAASVLLACGHFGFLYFSSDKEKTPQAETDKTDGTISPLTAENGSPSVKEEIIGGLKSRTEAESADETGLFSLTDGESSTDVASAKPTAEDDGVDDLPSLGDDSVAAETTENDASADNVAVNEAKENSGESVSDVGENGEVGVDENSLAFNLDSFDTPLADESSETESPTIGLTESESAGTDSLMATGSPEADKSTQESIADSLPDSPFPSEENVDSLGPSLSESLDRELDTAEQNLQAGANEVKETLQNASDQVSEFARQGSEQASDTLHQTGEAIGETIQNASDQVSEFARQGSEQASDTLHQTGEAIGETIQNASDQVNEFAQQTEEKIDSSLRGLTASGNSSLSASPAPVSTGSFGAARQAPLQVSTSTPSAAPSSLTLESTGGQRSRPSSLGEGASSLLDRSSVQTGDMASGTSSLGNSVATENSSLGTPATSRGNSSQGVSSSLNAVATPENVTSAISPAPDASADNNMAADGRKTTELLSNPSEIALPPPGVPFSNTLSPMGNYAAPGETIPSSATASVGAGPSTSGGTGLAPGTLSNLSYNPATGGQSVSGNTVSAGATTSGGTALSNGTLTSSGTAAGIGSPAVTNSASTADVVNYREYSTKSGDNLLIIAENELGDSSRWGEISQLNPGQNLRGRLQEGLVIKIPATSADIAPVSTGNNR